MAYAVRMGTRQFHGLRGNLHIHTPLSDGAKPHEDLGRIAELAGLDFIVVTDHNVYQPGLDGWVGKTLVLVGEEVHDPRRKLESSHLLCFDIQADVAAHCADPQAVVEAVAAQGGFTFLAHPFERDAADFLPEPNISWRDWQVEGYSGLELWNYMSEFKSLLKSRSHALLLAFAPALGISGPYPETLQKWDELLQTRPLAALGGSDAHGTAYRLGPWRRVVQPYDYLFQSINTHLLSTEPLNGELEHDKILIYGALRAGHSFLGYERLAPIAGFGFWARSGDAEATMGETLSLHKALEVHITTPARAWIRLLRDGKVVIEARGDHLALMSHLPGIYRVEAYRRYAGRRRGWIFSNPIYVRC